MSSFWLIASALLLLAALMLVLPVWLFRRAQLQVTNTQIIKARLAELEQEQQEGLLTAEDKQQAEKELKLALVEEDQVSHQATGNIALPLSIGCVIALVGGIWMYQSVNQLEKLHKWEQAREKLPELGRRIVMEADPSIEQKDLEDFALGIRTKLVEEPEDYTGWLLLGRLYSSLNRLESAIDAFEKGLKINPRHPALLSSYSRNLLLTGDESYIRTAMRNLQLLIRLKPSDIEAHSMLAVAATQMGETDLALMSWRMLANALPESHERYPAILAQISALEGKEDSAVSESSNAGPQILVNVELDETLRGKLPEQGYLFVFAQSADGSSRMPAAVSKTKLQQLPVQVSLSNANAMIASYTLSQLSEAKLVARVSADENVAQASGELQGEVVIQIEPDSVTQQRITIDKEIL